MAVYDYCVVGGGIVGCATAWQLKTKDPGAKLLILEKEEGPGKHQTGHNSGVIHTGIYYAPGSLKARLCREGLVATKAFCRAHGVPFEECGKLIVATNSLEMERVDALYERAVANGMTLERLGADALRKREPNITGVSALYSQETAIVDFGQVCRELTRVLVREGADVRYNARVSEIAEEGSKVDIVAGGERFSASQLVVCGGLQSDRLAKLAGLKVDFQIVPFRGEYFQLPENKRNIIRHLVYPAPDPSLPFLGIHLTRMIDGSVTVGPNAVIGFAREGYSKWSVSLRDAMELGGFSGFWKLMYHHRRHALHELAGSVNRRGYLRECQKYCPSLSLDDLKPYRGGIRAQAVTRDGEAVHDFLFMQTDRMLHVCNAPSPAATSALPIGRMVAEKCMRK